MNGDVIKIYEECGGHLLWLGSEDTVREAIAIAYGDDPGTIVDEGWMFDTGWNREMYERKRDFVEETGYEGWWEGCNAPADGKETKKLRHVWSFRYMETST